MIRVTLPLRTPNPLNGSHGHWRVKAKLRKHARLTAKVHVHNAIVSAYNHGEWRRPATTWDWYPPSDVTVTRIAPSRGLDPHDGLGAALKGVIDGVADALGVDDRDPRVSWELRQERGPWGVRIEIRPRAAREGAA